MINIRLLIPALLLLTTMNADAQLSYLQWVFGMGGAGNSPSYVNEVHDIHTLPSGEITAGGWAAGTIDIDPSAATFNVTSPGVTIFNGFFARYDSDRNLIRGYVLNCTSDAYVENVARDGTGMIYISGEYIGSLDVDPGPGQLLLNSQQGGRDMFIAKYDTAGNPLFAFSIGGALSSDQLYSMIGDSSGNTYITGSISDTIDFDPGPGQVLLNGTAGESMFLAKYNNAGQLQWAFLIDNSPLPQRGYSLATAPNGDIWVVMGFRGLIDANPSAGTASFAAVGAGDLLIARYSPAGTFVNAWQIGGPGGVSISESSIACDHAGNILIAGRFNGNLDTDPGPGTSLLSSLSGGSVFVARYQSTGQLNWSVLGANSHTGTRSTAFDSLGHAYVLTNDLISSGTLQKYNSNGQVIYTKPIIGFSGLVSRAFHLKGADAFLIGGGLRSSGSIDNALFGAGGSGYGAFLAQFGACRIPEILTQSADTIACEGSDVSLNVDATGTGLHYQWYLNGQVMTGDTAAQLVLINADTADTGSYSCIVTGTCGTDTSIAIQLNVEAYPQMSIQLLGNQLQALPAGLANYFWLNNNQPTGVTGSAYANPPPGIYSVVGINAGGCADTSALLAITGINELMKSSVTAYPNPATNQLVITFPSAIFESLELLTGNSQRLQHVAISDQQHFHVIDVTDLSAGHYILTLSGRQNIRHLPVVIE